MKVKYKNEKYNVKVKDAIKIKKRKILLFLRRIKRFGLRMLNVFKKDLVILFIAILLYVAIVCMVECNIMHKTIVKVIWETKAEVFTVFIVVALFSTISNEREWRRKIRNWHDIYTDNLSSFEYDIYDLLRFSGLNTEIDYNMLYTRELFEKFEKEFRKAELREKINNEKNNNILEKIKNEIAELKEEVYRNDFIEEKEEFIWEYRFLKNNIYRLQETIEEDAIDIKNELVNVFSSIYIIISFIRRTWRTEIDLDREIIDILKIDNKDRVENDYYLSALAYKNKEE